MRLLIVLILLIACVAGVGLYRGWFRVKSDSSAGASNVTITVDKDKIHEDKQKALGKPLDQGSAAKDQAPAPPATNPQ